MAYAGGSKSVWWKSVTGPQDQRGPDWRGMGTSIDLLIRIRVAWLRVLGEEIANADKFKKYLHCRFDRTC